MKLPAWMFWIYWITLTLNTYYWRTSKMKTWWHSFALIFSQDPIRTDLSLKMIKIDNDWDFSNWRCYLLLVPWKWQSFVFNYKVYNIMDSIVLIMFVTTVVFCSNIVLFTAKTWALLKVDQKVSKWVVWRRMEKIIWTDRVKNEV